MKNRFLLFSGILVFILLQPSLALETWTSLMGSKIEARLVKLDDDGNYVFETKDGKQKTVKPEQLAEESRLRADDKLRSLAEAAADEEVADTETKVVSGSPSFFGNPKGGTGGTGSNQTPSSPKPTSTTGPQSESIVGTTWSGESPWSGNKKIVTIRFEASRIHWQGKSVFYRDYKQIGTNSFQIQGKDKLFIKIIDSKTMKVSVGNKQKDTSTFRRE